MTIVDLLISKNPLLGHGPRTRRTGIVLTSESSSATRPRRARRDVDAPRIHLGHVGRTGRTA